MRITNLNMGDIMFDPKYTKYWLILDVVILVIWLVLCTPDMIDWFSLF